jgi:hypothetical protein
LPNTKPLLKGFGAAANVAGQIATDKAVNSRRTRSNFSQFDITKGQMISYTFPAGPEEVPHQLGRKPSSVFIAEPNPDDVSCTATSATSVTLDGPPGASVSVWVV